MTIVWYATDLQYTPSHQLPVRLRHSHAMQASEAIRRKQLYHDRSVTEISGPWLNHLTFLDLLDVVLEAVESAAK
jgi:hypothetical protein